ncbi:hypothetical protein FHS63_003678 [Azospirillum doebereinerae]|nr:hypothetical protein [Azospirillum doebereinerae]MCG5239410.1 hypothetical protein [Azospirillum doebereinerae]
MAEAFQPAVDLAGQRAVRVEHPVEHVAHRTALARQTEILHRHQFGDGEAVVHLGQAEVAARIGDAGLGVSTLGGDAGGHDMAAVPGAEAHLLAVRHGQLQGLDADRPALAQPPRDVRRGDDGAGRPVADAAAVEQPERVGHHGRVEHRPFGDGLAQMRLGVPHPVGVVLDRDMGHGALQILARQAVAGPVDFGQLREGSGRRVGRPPQCVQRPARCGNPP